MTSLLEYRNGYVANERELIVALEDFLLNQVGSWEVVYKINDVSTNRWYVFTSPGTEPGRFRPLYVSWQGTGNTVYNTMWTHYVNPGTNTDYVYNGDYNSAPTGGIPFRYYFFGDADGVWVGMQCPGQDHRWFTLYTGYFDSYYSDAVEDYYPACVAGQPDADRFFDSNRVLTYANWATSSGTALAVFTSTDPYTNMLAYASPSARDGSHGFVPLILIRNTGNADTYEVRGELKHTVQFSGQNLAYGSWIVISGTNHKYMVFGTGYNSAAPAECHGIGPILSSSGIDWLA